MRSRQDLHSQPKWLLVLYFMVLMVPFVGTAASLAYVFAFLEVGRSGWLVFAIGQVPPIVILLDEFRRLRHNMSKAEARDLTATVRIVSVDTGPLLSADSAQVPSSHASSVPPQR